MTTYKYTLRRGGRKEICPNCGQRRFVPYVLTEDNETIVNPVWGRCDRENSCGYWMKPDGNIHVEPKQPAPPAIPMWVSPKILMTIRHRDDLYKYARWLVGDERAATAWHVYSVLSASNGGTVFLQIDNEDVIRAGKIIRYKSGHRVKDGQPVQWLHKDRDFKRFVKGEALRQCFFGEHLLKQRPSAPVVIVESEKTALLMSAIRTEFIWLASGGSCNLQNPEKNKVLDGRDVTVCPDNGMFIKWRQIALPKGWKVDETCLPARDGFKEGYDILDLYEKWAIDDEHKMERNLL